ncbi:hypothetical protein [Aquimarina algiphila]|uniref:Uncharacterized protein n=1 Tax=Aquimarina algiphila TaxID=2047982 RepID=A0A554VL05_9FLAO|nr:hypothetical protein [Aquimarina algiphila]TSE08789.1 hypothetical protein FOF46_10825 [Aquimarina algiphila]
MEPSTQEKTIGTKIFAIIKGVIAFLVVTLSLFHIFLEPKSKAQLDYAPKYKEEVRRLDSLQLHYITQLENKEINADQYVLIAKQHLASYEPSLKKISSVRRSLAQEHSFRGRSSLHFWLFVFGLVIALFFFSCKSLKDDFSRGSTFKFHFVSLTGILVSGFWFIHLIFLTQKDFTQNNYIAAILFGALLFSVFVYFLVKYYTYKDDIIYKQLWFIEKVKTTYFYNMSIKAKYAEKHKTSIPSSHNVKNVDETIDDFQKDLNELITDV